MKYAGTVNAPDIPSDLEWLNTEHPLSLRSLRGKVVLLDFWTYCCINCMHILPDLKKLEEKYANELVVIGVHSAKFATEGDTESIRQAVLRYDIAHPVVNDNGFRLWRQYGVRAWPTLMLIDPAGKVIGQLSGEGIYEPLDSVIAEVISAFDAVGKLDRTPLVLVHEREKAPNTLLAYPGKIVANEAGTKLFFTDSNHNRIVVCTPLGEVLQVVGSGAEGAGDGTLETASFFRPQGLAYDDAHDVLYVADTENHLVRKVDFRSGVVSTLAGTGAQARRYNVEGNGKEVALNSPWDIVLIDETLYIAMAGSHQLWALSLRTLDARVYAGSGREDLIDGALKSAALAQPSGITTDGARLYIADSEVSAVRTVGLAADEDVATLVGEGLFEFGDIDGSYPAARLQHPLGVVWHDGAVYVADTYNHKIKRIDPVRRTVRTVVGTGTKGYRDGAALSAQLSEPAGLAIAGSTMYIADTNNGLIRTVDMKAWTVSTLALSGVERLARAVAAEPRIAVSMPELRVHPQAAFLRVVLSLPVGTKLNTDAPLVLRMQSANAHVLRVESTREHTAVSMLFPVVATEGSTVVDIDASVYYCAEHSEALCYIGTISAAVPVTVAADGAVEPVIVLSVEQ